MKTFKYRLKDRKQAKLARMSSSVNYVWNYCSEVSRKSWRQRRKVLSGFDLNYLTGGISKELGLNSTTVQAVGEQYAKSSKQHKKCARFRSYKRNLGWIPFKSTAVKVEGDTVRYCGEVFKFWKSRDLEGQIKTGGFHQDSKGRWYVTFVCSVEQQKKDLANLQPVGIDLGLKQKLTLSNGQQFDRENLTKKHETKLAMAQRAGKKKQVTNIHAKIKNSRSDWAHKTTTKIVNNYSKIVVGGVESTSVILNRRNMAKSVYDASWFQLRQLLKYKANTLGVGYVEVNEAYTTQTCNVCQEKTGPKGLKGLSVREWECGCGASHNRDVNAAQNILRLGHQTPKGNPRPEGRGRMSRIRVDRGRRD